MFTASYLSVLELVEKLDMILGHRGIQNFHKFNGIQFYLLNNLINVLLNCKKVSFYPTKLLKTHLILLLLLLNFENLGGVTIHQKLKVELHLCYE